MKIRLNLVGAERLMVHHHEDKAPDPDKRKQIEVGVLKFEVTPFGQEEGTFAAQPSGLLHVSNLSPEAANQLALGGSFILEQETSLHDSNA